MTENVPPSAAGANATANSDQPGRPYYESLRATLRQTLDKKRKLDEQLAAIEDQIFKTEGAYLEETANSGNIIKGFDGWVKGVQVGQKAVDDRRRGRFKEDERLFSRSSVSWVKDRRGLDVLTRTGQAQEGPDSSAPSAAPTPTGSNAPSVARGNEGGGNTKSGNKKKRPTEKDDDEDGKANKRGKISYARD
ncbi:hypothetical protein D0866_09636 [Hortaea werneckii]|uniref:Chromatin modification-related protein EAF6 n=1 Tax=Hortaea werneckii TaxID=91943 RepID=A0A3M7AKM6_HORWE|nr:hypothetical protein D0866_09636 [Hortaea werneckii]